MIKRLKTTKIWRSPREIGSIGISWGKSAVENEKNKPKCRPPAGNPKSETLNPKRKAHLIPIMQNKANFGEATDM